MSNFLTIFLYIISGIISGFFGGMGMGGGTLLIPLLTIFLGVGQKLSQGVNLMSFLLMAIFSLFIHYKNGLVKTKGVGFLLFGGIIFSVVGSVLAVFLPNQILKKLFGGFLCLFSFIQVVKVLKK